VTWKGASLERGVHGIERKRWILRRKRFMRFNPLTEAELSGDSRRSWDIRCVKKEAENP